MEIEYSLKSKVWLYPGKASWHFVDIGKVPSKEIKDNSGPLRRGFGSVPVEVKIGKTSWKTSIFPVKDKGYILPLKKSVRNNENISIGDIIEFSILIREF